MSLVKPKLVDALFRRVRPRARERAGAWRYVVRPERLRRYTRIVPLRSGAEAFPAMLEAIACARRSILVEMYIWQDDRTGNRFREALIERARAGVVVRVIVDGLGSFSLPDSFLESMRVAGAEVHRFHPIAPWRARWGWNKRDHKKILVVDDVVGFTGGINFSDENLPVEEGGDGWFDWHARVDGPAVRDLAATFRHTWLQIGATPYDAPPLPAPFLGRNALGAQVISNVRLQDRWRMHRAYTFAIRQATQRIDIMNSYFIPEFGLRRAFRHAVERGVCVRIIVPSVSDVRAVEHASRHLHKRLIQSGVRVFEWPERMMHAKFGVVDGTWSTIGSYNLDHRSLMHNLEVGLVVVDETLGKRLADQFDLDVARCREVTLAALDARPRLRKFFDWFWYQLRFWL